MSPQAKPDKNISRSIKESKLTTGKSRRSSQTSNTTDESFSYKTIFLFLAILLGLNLMLNVFNWIIIFNLSIILFVWRSLKGFDLSYFGTNWVREGNNYFRNANRINKGNNLSCYSYNIGYVWIRCQKQLNNVFGDLGCWGCLSRFINKINEFLTLLIKFLKVDELNF